VRVGGEKARDTGAQSDRSRGEGGSPGARDVRGGERSACLGPIRGVSEQRSLGGVMLRWHA